LVILADMQTSLHEGDHALIINGPFAGKLGTITRIGSDSATVVCDLFDRDTPVEVDLSDLEQP
jgi:transcription antitermination factor NusG